MNHEGSGGERLSGFYDKEVTWALYDDREGGARRSQSRLVATMSECRRSA
ncbi:MAG TPA: hypothetical protein V6C97_24970 [Oculatellaceae cyanobacterium]